MRKIFYAAIAAVTLALSPHAASAAPVAQPGAVKALAGEFGATTQVQHRRSWSHARWGSGRRYHSRWESRRRWHTRWESRGRWHNRWRSDRWRR